MASSDRPRPVQIIQGRWGGLTSCRPAHSIHRARFCCCCGRRLVRAAAAVLGRGSMCPALVARCRSYCRRSARGCYRVCLVRRDWYWACCCADRRLRRLLDRAVSPWSRLKSVDKCISYRSTTVIGCSPARFLEMAS
jgi:hypothetical protein